jgi:hypothetical protein
MRNNRRPLALLSGLVAVVACWMLFIFLTTGRVVIETNTDSSTILVTRAPDAKHQNQEQPSKQGTGSLSLRLKAGTYVVSVSAKSLATNQVITISPRTTTHYTIRPVQPTIMEPVLPAEAQSIIADTNQLLFLNTAESTLYKLDASNNLSAIVAQNGGVRSISWADTEFGVGQYANGALFIVRNGSLASFSPVSGIDYQYSQVMVTADRHIYISDRNRVYAGRESGGFKQVFSGRSSGAFMVVGRSKIALVDSGDSDGGKDEKPSVTVIDALGVHAHRAVGTFHAAWSSNDNYLAISSAAGGEVLDKNLRHVAAIPQKNFNTLTWLNNDVLLYAIGSQLWSYSVRSEKSQIISVMPTGAQITSLSVNANRSYVYLTYLGFNDTTAIGRVGLIGQSTPPDIYKLSVFLPTTIGICSASYSNFSYPSVLLTSPDGGSLDNCKSQLRSYLETAQVDPGKLQFSVASRPVYGD